MRVSLFIVLAILGPAGGRAALPPEQVEFFESRIRPVLAQDCYECHSTTTKQKAGLVLDSRAGWQKGGDSGDAIIPGDPKGSLLLKTIRHLEPDLKMPKNGAKLEDRVVQDFEKWIAMGAPDPRDAVSPPAEIAHDRDWKTVLERRKNWWSFQPVQHHAPPAATAWSAQPIDRFLEQAMTARGLAPAADAEARTILRRLTYVLTGLAPTTEETEHFAAEAATNLDGAIAAAADRLLASPRFGEQWARHWMDWLRYAESHGGEGDPLIPYAWRFRDYLIRALNADLPFPQLVREQIAGDLLEHPRTNEALGINESALGAAPYRFVLHGFSPTDSLDEQITFTDNQIDVLSKAYLGLTVSCARCHNHKFDAISQTDFYALYGVMASCRPALIDVNLPARQSLHVDELKALKEKLRAALAEEWLQQLDGLPARLQAWKPADKKQEDALVLGEVGPLAAWLKLTPLPVEKYRGAWDRLTRIANENAKKLAAFRAAPALQKWDLSSADERTWLADGAGLAQGPSGAGAFHIESAGDRVVTDILPAGLYTHLVSDRQRGVLSSPRFPSEGGKLWLHVRGDGEARARYVVQNYPRSGTVHKKLELTGGAEQWASFDLDYWKGDQIYVELATEADQPVETKNAQHSWFGVGEVICLPSGESAVPPPPGAPLQFVSEGEAPADADALAARYVSAARRCVEAWAAGTLSDLEATFLGQLVRFDLLPTRLQELPGCASLVEEYRRIEAQLAAPTRAPGVLEGFAFDQTLFTRGDHKHPAEIVPRRFLEAIDPTPFAPGEHQSGRLTLAESLVSPTNPLTNRVLVNRLWHYVYGRGIVGTPDNFGRLGELPSHPELLDYLASEFANGGGSLKQMLRTLVTARAFRTASRPSAEMQERDPENRLLCRFTARRLEAEAIRDTMLELTGKLREPTPGAECPPGKDDPMRRSVYTPIIRNRLDPLLSAFDFPVPTSTRGRRDATNVPAQALALLNDPAVIRWAGLWAERTQKNGKLPDDDARVGAMFAEAFGRAPSPEEVRESLDFIGPARDWHVLAEALFNAKEFIYLH